MAERWPLIPICCQGMTIQVPKSLTGTAVTETEHVSSRVLITVVVFELTALQVDVLSSIQSVHISFKQQ